MAKEEQGYTMENALEEAYGLLEDRFGKVEQSAAVALAAALLNSKPREDFVKRQHQTDEIPYTG